LPGPKDDASSLGVAKSMLVGQREQQLSQLEAGRAPSTAAVVAAVTRSAYQVLDLRNVQPLMSPLEDRSSKPVPARVLVMSGRPGRMLCDFNVPFEYPRSPRLRFDERFAHLAGQVSTCLRGGV
jgi:hypothetical protein